MILGIDMGGTHIDGAAIEKGVLLASVKHQVNRDDYFLSIWQCLEELIYQTGRRDITRIHLSTTICTNAIVEGQVSEVGLVLQTGPGLKWPFERMGDTVVYLSGSVDHRGKVVRDLDMEELRRVRGRLLASQAGALSVVCKFSTRNPVFEQRIRDYFEDSYDDITMGHTLSGKLNFPRRVQTAYLNAAVSRTFRLFAGHMREALEREGIRAPVFVLKADGGTIDFTSALRKPVETILSGPAASFMGMHALSEADRSDRVLLDIGGTTTDLFFLVDGVPVFEPLGIEIDGRKTLVRAIFSQSVGIGGDSRVFFDNGKLQIGPRRLGFAVAFGGDAVTPTDALVYLNKMEGKYPGKSRRALEALASENDLSAGQLADLIVTRMCGRIREEIDRILQRLNASPVYTIEELLRDRMIRPRAVEVIGGPAKALAGYLEKALSMPVFCPAHHAIANAIGAALAKPTVEVHMIADTERKTVSIPELGIYQPIDRQYTQKRAEQFALSEVRKAGASLGLTEAQTEPEIVESSCFNMVQGYGGGMEKNIRVKAQIRPGLLYKLERDEV